MVEDHNIYIVIMMDMLEQIMFHINTSVHYNTELYGLILKGLTLIASFTKEENSMKVVVS